LHVDPRTQATELMIRSPGNFYVPPHWHSANETHTVLRGTFTVEGDGSKETLNAGGFNYIPAKMVHRGWIGPEGMLVFITVEGAWDINWVNGPPSSENQPVLQKRGGTLFP
ncbi:MAG: cupin domain-containing protein, partial [bacterium]